MTSTRSVSDLEAGLRVPAPLTAAYTFADHGAAGLGQGSKQQAAGGRQLATLLVVTAWFACNVCTALLNKYVLAVYAFKHPVFLTLCHMVACSALAQAAASARLVPAQRLRSRALAGKVAGLAAVFCASVVAGNTALRYIPVSFSQAISATTPFFAALFSFLILGTREAGSVYAALVPVVAGVVITSGAEPLFDLNGLLAGLTATALRGLKSVMQARLLTNPAERLDSMNLLRCMAPVALCLLAPACLLLEPGALPAARRLGAEQPGFYVALAASSVLAYFLNLTNFLVTRHTSAITLQVLGNAKSVLAVAASVALFRNPVTVGSVAGFGITLAGVALYSAAKRRAKVKHKQAQRTL